ncbi:HU family DNA-binding protein [Azospirillum canadense]|uniref:HU family DNA-binding protein n=1 Tax=Azospirillum canadense TaxID=403962 RepID=UPI003873ADA1|nr:nucleoid DNA-binding protein [Azospirillum canadense]
MSGFTASVRTSLHQHLQDALIKGETVKLPGFGKFEIAERGERTGRNPQTGAEITIAASKAPKFSAGKALKDAINNGKAV